jgi:hypothetical protein
MKKAILIALAFCLTAPAGWADEWNKKTIVTLREPLQVPGTTLQPGKYVFKLVDSLSNRNIVRITNEAEDHVYTTFIAIPNYRLEPTDKTTIGLWETPVGNPPDLRAWFYPGDNFGQEIAYPKDTAIRLAEWTKQPVLETEAREVAELRTAPVTTVDKTGKELTWVEPEPEPVPVPVPVPVAVAEPTPTPVPVPVPEPPAKMPATSSPLGTIALIGLGAFGAGMGLRSITGPSRRV